MKCYQSKKLHVNWNLVNSTLSTGLSWQRLDECCFLTDRHKMSQFLNFPQNGRNFTDDNASNITYVNFKKIPGEKPPMPRF